MHMKGIRLLMLLALYSISIISCSKKDKDVPIPDDSERTYTIMMYGCAGGNLDRAMIMNIQEALIYGSSDRVKFTGQVKFSDRFQDTEEFKGTQRFIIGAENGIWYTPEEVLDSELELFNPKNLTDFINWSKEKCPSDDYILLLWNHGSAWMPEFDAPDSRAIIHDDILDSQAMTLDELVKGIKDSGTKMKMIYYDACLMGMLEVVTGIRECAEYALCSSHVTPDMGGDYTSLMYHLNHSSDFEEAISGFCREVVSHWNSLDMSLDLTLIDLANMDKLLEEIKVLSGYMEDAAKITSQCMCEHNGEACSSQYDDDHKIATTFKNALNNSYHYIWLYEEDGVSAYPYYDIMSLAEILANGPTNSYSARFVNIASRINRAMDDAIVCKQLTSVIERWNFSLGVTIVNSDAWTKYGYDSTYEDLDFDRQTGWGKWLSVNPILPAGNPNPFTLIGQNEDDEEEEDIPLDQEIDFMLNMIGKR